MSVLYRLSDVLCFVLFRGIGYRQNVIQKNIDRSFPEKSATEKNAIKRAFNRHLCGLIMESIKLFSISEKQLLKRMACRNPQIMTPYFDQGRGVIICAGHYNNWEWSATAIGLEIKHTQVGIYTPLSNSFFEEKMKVTRGKHGMILLPKKEVKSFFEQTDLSDKAIIFATDQSPRSANSSYWINFLHQDTPVAFGCEKYAKKYNLPVFYAHIKKIKRGYYESEFELITDKPQRTASGEITEKHTRLLEADIREQPEYWLWSHKRWKLQREKEDKA